MGHSSDAGWLWGNRNGGKCKNSLLIVQFLGKMNWLGNGNRCLSRHLNPDIN